MSTRCRLIVSAVLVSAFTVGPVHRALAQDQPASDQSRASALGLFFLGAAAGLGIHESGHVIAGAVLGGHPTIVAIHYGGLPFFAIHHDDVSRRKEFVISSAGFWMQHAGSELLLSKRPNLKDERAPLLKGVFAFNVGASVVYSISAFGTFGPPERDPRSMAASVGRTGIPEPAIGGLILAPALLDLYRYERPDARWATWASRGAKIVAVLLVVR